MGMQPVAFLAAAATAVSRPGADLNPGSRAFSARCNWLLTESYHVLHISNDLKYDIF
jgi:hypothetical protein